jgi:hypothetical protein
MRRHGIVDFPDPQFSDGGGRVKISLGGKGSEINPRSPQFQAAMKSCQGQLPQKGAGSKFSTNGGVK